MNKFKKTKKSLNNYLYPAYKKYKTGCPGCKKYATGEDNKKMKYKCEIHHKKVCNKIQNA